MRLTYAFLNTSAHPEWTDQVDMFKSMLPDIDLDVYNLHEGRIPTNPSRHRGAILCGSHDNVHPEPPSYYEALAELIRIWADQPSFRLLGVCFGAQVIAKAMGGDVKFCARRICGVAHLRFTDEMRRMYAALQLQAVDCSILSTHKQCIVRLPENSILLAYSQDASSTINECFITGRHRNVLAIQSHPEYTRRILETRLCPGTVPSDFQEGRCLVAFVRAFVGDWNAIRRVLLLHSSR